MSAVALALALAMPLLHSGERQWFMPGALRPGAKVVCVGNGARLVLTVPRGPSGNDVWRSRLRASVSTRENGAVEFDCGVTAPPPRITPPRWLVSRNGPGLLRGPVTRARLEALYGTGAAGPRCTAERWPAIGLRATFAGCAPQSRLTGATVAGDRWSSLDDVRVGDSVARMLWQDVAAKRVHGAWILGGVGRQRPPRLVALVGAAGTVTGFRIVAR